jgi:formylglycine-generating enzyme required for sulfatase activity
MKVNLLFCAILILLVWTACDAGTKTVDSCGDDFVDPGEACDGAELGGATCASLGHYNQVGTLVCSAGCQFDTTDCGGRCGDNEVDITDGEQCDRESLNGKTCASLGFVGGTLSCTEGCQYDTSGCSSRCGDGIIQAGDDEVCDGPALDGQSCTTLGYHGGNLVCATDCKSLIIDNCLAAGRCGDDQIQSTYDEQCDGADLDGQTCFSRGYSASLGELGCTVDCLFDETTCVARSTNAELAHLGVSTGVLVPAFSPSVTTYAVQVFTAVEDLTVTASVADPLAGVAIAPSQPVTLAAGDNTVTVTVTAESGLQQAYTVTIHRQPPVDYTSPNIGTLKFVPGGEFQRDAISTNRSRVSAFRMARHEITRAQWVAVTGLVDPSQSGNSTGTNDPVQYVNWYHAIVFCNKLSLLEGLAPVYAINGSTDPAAWGAIPTGTASTTWDAVTADWIATGYRLPTEMEWQWAAMGATDTYSKPFAGSTGSNLIQNYAVFGWSTTEAGRTTTATTQPVGSRLPNELGLYDMSGNVWEFCWDWSAAYPVGAIADYRGPATGTRRATRGGTWYHEQSACSVAERSSQLEQQSSTFGFRVARW